MMTCGSITADYNRCYRQIRLCYFTVLDLQLRDMYHVVASSVILCIIGPGHSKAAISKDGR